MLLFEVSTESATIYKEIKKSNDKKEYSSFVAGISFELLIFVPVSEISLTRPLSQNPGMRFNRKGPFCGPGLALKITF